MNFNEYRPLALRTAKMFPTQIENLRHAALGLITETGEFATEVKRIVYGREMTPEMRDHMIEELGDAQWYAPLAFMALGADPKPVDMRGMMIGNLGDAAMLIAGMAGAFAACVYSGDTERERASLIDFLSSGIALIDRTAALLEIDAYEIRERNIAKLRLRYPDAYTDAAAEARADKAGVDARNS